MRSLADSTLLLGLGGNLGGASEVVRRMRLVADAVSSWGPVVRSPVYRTAALGPPQPEYLNAALRVTLAAPPWQPHELITAVLEVERLAGRDRRGQARWGPRLIDVDVLAWGARVLRWPGPPELEVPHPRWAQRRFALAPAVDVLDHDGEGYELPGTGRSLGQWLREPAVAEQAVERTELQL